jgi:hypothetical protein
MSAREYKRAFRKFVADEGCVDFTELLLAFFPQVTKENYTSNLPPTQANRSGCMG